MTENSFQGTGAERMTVPDGHIPSDMSTRIAVVSVHDPATGGPTLAAAVVGWRPGWTYWEWMPRCSAANTLRYGQIHTLDEPAREQWLTRYYEHPTLAYSVDEIEQVLAAETTDTEVLEQKVHDALDELLVEGL